MLRGAGAGEGEAKGVILRLSLARRLRVCTPLASPRQARQEPRRRRVVVLGQRLPLCH